MEVSQNYERTYLEHAHGLVTINYRSESNSAEEDREEKLEAQKAKETYAAARERCTLHNTQEEHYSASLSMGFDYGAHIP